MPELNKLAAQSGERIVGAAPPGARDEAAAADAVREMFTSIAPRYDLLNHVLSMNVDRLWWNRTARVFSEVLRRPNAQVLDLCCGTGDMAFALHRRRDAGTEPPHRLSALISLTLCWCLRGKSPRAKRFGGSKPTRLRLPFSSGQFQLVTSAFGFRNLANYDRGLAEIYRVLAPEGEVGILDFGEPKGVLGKLYRVYFRRVLPAIGTLISGVRGPYSYLPASVLRFPSPNEMLERMRAAGFRDVSWTPYSFGIAGLYRGKK